MTYMPYMHRLGSRAQGIADAVQGWSEAHFLDRQCTWLRAVSEADPVLSSVQRTRSGH